MFLLFLSLWNEKYKNVFLLWKQTLAVIISWSCTYKYFGDMSRNAQIARVGSWYQFSCSAIFDSLWPHGLQYKCPVHHHLPELFSNSWPSSRWYHPTISSSDLGTGNIPDVSSVRLCYLNWHYRARRIIFWDTVKDDFYEITVEVFPLNLRIFENRPLWHEEWFSSKMKYVMVSKGRNPRLLTQVWAKNSAIYIKAWVF